MKDSNLHSLFMHPTCEKKRSTENDKLSPEVVGLSNSITGSCRFKFS